MISARTRATVTKGGNDYMIYGNDAFKPEPPTLNGQAFTAKTFTEFSGGVKVLCQKAARIVMLSGQFTGQTAYECLVHTIFLLHSSTLS